MSMKNANILDWIALLLLVIGGLNWGLVGFFHFDLVAKIFGTMTTVSKIAYDVIGVCAIYVIIRALTGGSKAAA